MFYLRREMEERDAGRSADAALEAAAATSGRAVLVSGLTVMAAMAGMFLAGNAVFVSFGIGTIIVVAVAMLGSLTRAARRCSRSSSRKGWTEKGRVPCVAKRRHKTGGESRVWGAILDRVLKRPLRLGRARRRRCSSRWRSRRSRCTRSTRASTGLPRDLEVMQAYDRIDAAFPGGARAGRHGRQGRRRHRAGGPEPRSPICSSRRSPRASSTSRRASTSARTRPSRRSRSRSRAPAPTRRRSASLAVLRDDVVPATVGKLRRRRGRRHRLHGRARRTSTT